MKTLFIIALLTLGSLNSFAGNLPIEGDYKLYENLEGGCFGLSVYHTFTIEVGEAHQKFKVGRLIPGFGHSGTFNSPAQDILPFFQTSSGFGIHRSEPTKTGLVRVSELSFFNGGHGIHVKSYIEIPSIGYEMTLIEGYFELDGDKLHASFLKERSGRGTGIGRCVLKRI